MTKITNQLESLRRHSTVVADSGDIDAVARWKPQDATTNPSLLLAAAGDARYRRLVEDAVARGGGGTEATMEHLFVNFGREILGHIAGVSDARLVSSEQVTLPDKTRAIKFKMKALWKYEPEKKVPKKGTVP